MTKNYTLIMSARYGSSKLCTQNELVAWFNSLEKNDQHNEYISRLYKRYVRFEDLEETEKALFAIKDKSDVGKMLYEAYLVGKKGSLLFWEDWNKYLPIHIWILERPYFYLEVGKSVPLDDLNNLEGDPLWMCPEYMLEKYGK